ncbi:hypothetical protein AC579_7956 [Pseudocercospora musae]|uniref:Uncharacterized protein n=1 Tax=Pseudocercospora musae TaxID=113226 RepID=A0A139I8R0_9PEZI|nr:hypothetical protein AC579_7956 [Pseudocercospora musae]
MVTWALAASKPEAWESILPVQDPEVVALGMKPDIVTQRAATRYYWSTYLHMTILRPPFLAQQPRHTSHGLVLQPRRSIISREDRQTLVPEVSMAIDLDFYIRIFQGLCIIDTIIGESILSTNLNVRISDPGRAAQAHAQASPMSHWLVAGTETVRLPSWTCAHFQAASKISTAMEEDNERCFGRKVIASPYLELCSMSIWKSDAVIDVIRDGPQGWHELGLHFGQIFTHAQASFPEFV